MWGGHVVRLANRRCTSHVTDWCPRERKRPLRRLPRRWRVTTADKWLINGSGRLEIVVLDVLLLLDNIRSSTPKTPSNLGDDVLRELGLVYLSVLAMYLVFCTLKVPLIRRPLFFWFILIFLASTFFNCHFFPDLSRRELFEALLLIMCVTKTLCIIPLLFLQWFICPYEFSQV